MTWGAIGAGAIGLVGGMLTKNKNKSSNQQVQQAQERMDPYAAYRPQAALALNNLMMNPGTITDTPEYKARQQATARIMAAQGYTGSGNALVGAAEAGGQSYQQAFNNLAMLSGASGQPGAGSMQGAGITSANNQNALNSYGQIANGIVGSGITAWNNYQNQQAFNQPIDTGSNDLTIAPPTSTSTQISDIPLNLPRISYAGN